MEKKLGLISTGEKILTPFFRKKIWHKMALSIQEWTEIYTCRKIKSSYDVHFIWCMLSCVYYLMWLCIWGLHWKEWQLILFNILNLICKGDWLWTCKDPPSPDSWMRRVHNKFYPPWSSLLLQIFSAQFSHSGYRDLTWWLPEER